MSLLLLLRPEEDIKLDTDDTDPRPEDAKDSRLRFSAAETPVDFFSPSKSVKFMSFPIILVRGVLLPSLPERPC